MLLCGGPSTSQLIGMFLVFGIYLLLCAGIVHLLIRYVAKYKVNRYRAFYWLGLFVFSYTITIAVAYGISLSQ